jgi:phenylpropionate dioxygenase-like ring-hydroxylating dioxygenase large terminal subunit
MCGFHGWTWNLDGSLANIPCRWDFPQVTEEDFALPEVRCESWSQFVFVNFDDEAPPLIEALDIIPEHYEHFPMDNKFTAAWVQKVIPANWKTTMEAFLESYHTIVTHPQVVEHLDDADTQYDIWNTASRLYTPSGVPSGHLGEVGDEDVYAAAVEFYAGGSPDVPTDLPAGTGARAAVAGLTRTLMMQGLGVDLAGFSIAEVIDHIEYWVFPNWCPFPGATNALQYRFRPNGHDPDSCIFDVRMMFPVPAGQPRPPAAKLRVLQSDEPWTNAPELMQFCQIMTQDEANLAALQQGMKATKRDALTFSDYHESRIRHFHALLDDYLADPSRPTLEAEQR